MEFSKLIGKQVFTQNGELLGYVTGLYLTEDLSSISHLCCADEEEEEFCLPFSSVSKIGDALFAQNLRAEKPEGVPCPVGKAVYDENGNFLGAASGLTSGSCGVLTVRTPLGEKEFSARRILVGDTVIFRAKSNTGSKKAVKRQLTEDEKISPAALTDEVYRNNLMGKKVKTDLEGIASEGEIVSAEMIARAHERGRLLELTSAVFEKV